MLDDAGMDFDPAKMIERQRDLAAQRLARAAAYLSNEIKATLSTPAPRAGRAKGRSPRAATRATKGAPPRKLTGRLRASIVWRVDKDKLTAVVGSNVAYATWEWRGHPYAGPTAERNRAKLNEILRGG